MVPSVGSVTILRLIETVARIPEEATKASKIHFLIIITHFDTIALSPLTTHPQTQANLQDLQSEDKSKSNRVLHY